MEETASLRIAVDTAGSWARDFGGDGHESSDDFGPMVRACPASVHEMGPGTVLRIQGKDGELVFSLE